MKKYFALLAITSLVALYGCAGEDNAAQPFLEPDINTPDTLVGSYDISYFSIQDGTNILTTDCTQAEIGAPAYNICEPILQMISHRVSIQKHWDIYRYVYSVVVQMQLDSDRIQKNENEYFKDHAYHHLIFPIQESYFTSGFGVDAISKATDRGLTKYFIEPPYGDFYNSNSYINNVSIEDGNVVIALKSGNGQKTYIFKLKKVSNDSGNYVYLVDVPGPQGGLRAVSSIRNDLMVTEFSDGVLNSYFNEEFAILE